MLARKIAIGVGIALIFPLLIYYGVSTFHPPPRHSEYFQAGGDWEDPEKRGAFDAAAKSFARTLYFVAAPLGIAAILIGPFLAVQAIGTGLIFGGIFAVAGGYWWYWDWLENWLRFVSLAVAAGVLVYVGYRKTTA